MKVVVVGGGAGGMFAAIFAAKNGAKVTLIEKNEKLGKKIYITGKGRCNVTNDCSAEKFLENVTSNSKFLSGALYTFTPQDCIRFFEDNGLKLKTERGNRVFPESDKASDVTKTLEKCLRGLGVEIKFNTEMTGLVIVDGKVTAVKTKGGNIVCDKVILSTGGATYTATGSDGGGIELVRTLGHNIIPLTGSLNGLKTQPITGAAGLTLKNVSVSATKDSGVLAQEFGELLFTHTGVSGPAVLTLSGKINRLTDFRDAYIEIDLKPALDEKTLDLRLQRDFMECNNKNFGNSLDALLPRALIPEVIKRSGIDSLSKVHQITAAQRKNLLTVLKQFKLKMHGHESMETAVVSAGGVDTGQIIPSTMESKLIKGLYFAGEMIDVDALTGGFNLQIAFSTGVKAGISAAKEK